VHYRGTDKVLEAPLVNYDKVILNIEYYLRKFPETNGVFISSDDINFIEYIKKASIRKPIIYRDDSFRSRDGKPVHKVTDINIYEMNRDALVNCLILSRCNALIKGASILSAWSKLFNPQLDLVMLNTPYDQKLWFPERELIKEVIYTAI
jgi:CMP-N-acetylneuraminic acid synthetase